MSQTTLRRYLRHGTLAQLRVFETVARLGSFTRTAETLHMAQPTVSVQIRKLTETVGAPLLEQIGKKIYLTDAGGKLYAACRDVFARLAEADAAIADSGTLQGGTLRLAVSTCGQYFAPQFLNGFCQQYPKVEATLTIMNREGLIRRLKDNADDLYVFANPPRDAGLVLEPILPNPIVAVARADHPLARERNIAFERFARQPFIAREPGSGTQLAAQRAFAARGFTPCVRMQLGSTEAVKHAVMAGLGVSIMSRYLLGETHGHGQPSMLDVEGFPLNEQWYLAYATGKQLSAVARRFAEHVRSEALKWDCAGSLRSCRPGVAAGITGHEILNRKGRQGTTK